MQKMAFSIGLNGQIWLKRLFVAMATPFFFFNFHINITV
jgi:hypothetical protein